MTDEGAWELLISETVGDEALPPATPPPRPGPGPDLPGSTPCGPASEAQRTATVPGGRSAEQTLLQPGDLVDGRFEVLRLVGCGGMGQVFEAVQRDLDRHVALKVLRPALAAQPRQRERLLREARAASRILHPGSVAVHDFGEWRGLLFIAMEFVQGRSLEAMLDHLGAFEPLRAVDLTLKVCSVLETAHAQGVLHRDLKPGNILVTQGPDGTEHVRVVDFGLALLLDRPQDVRLTTEGSVVGTPGYMPPEQFQGRPLDPRSDLYALGVILYEMLCGALPYSGGPTEYLVQALYQDPPAPSRRSTTAVQLDPALEQLVLRTLAKRPSDRPASVAAFRQELELLMQRSQRLDPEEQQRRQALLLGDRQTRTELLGLTPLPVDDWRDRSPATTARPASGQAEAGLAFLVIEPPGEFLDSLTAALRAQGQSAVALPGLDAALDWAGALPPHDVLLVELDCEQPASALERLGEFIARRPVGGPPVAVVGPDDSIPLISRALELGVAEWVPESQRVSRLSRLTARLRRRLRGRGLQA